MNEVTYDSRYKLYNCKIYICYISFIDIVFSFNCHLSHLNSFNLRSLIISVFVATMIYHVYRACARLRIFLAHKGPRLYPEQRRRFRQLGFFDGAHSSPSNINSKRAESPISLSVGQLVRVALLGTLCSCVPTTGNIVRCRHSRQRGQRARY